MSLINDTSESAGKGDISHFGALATALAATVGTGSIVGVATAILSGGPGAIFLDVDYRYFWHCYEIH